MPSDLSGDLRMPVVGGRVLYLAMVEDVRAWNKHAASSRTAATGRFSPEWSVHCEQVLRADHMLARYPQMTPMKTSPPTAETVERVRLLRHMGGVWALWQGVEDGELIRSQNLLVTSTDLSSLCAVVSVIVAGGRPRVAGTTYVPSATYLEPEGWLLVEEMLTRHTNTPTNPSIDTSKDPSSGLGAGLGESTPLVQRIPGLNHLAAVAFDPPEFVRRMTSTLTHRIMEAEFQSFALRYQARTRAPTSNGDSETRGFPFPSHEGGLPEGWVVRWHNNYSGLDTHVPTNDFDTFVVQRDGGGWALVLHSLDDSGAPRTTMWEAASMTIEELYWTAQIQAVLFPGEADGPEGGIRKFVVAQYQPDDPAEAAEQVLVALGASVRIFPHALAGR